MAEISPFRALMPTPGKAHLVAAVPYDVVNTAEAAALAEGNPLSFLRVSRPEIELPQGTDLYSDHVYEKAAANFQRLIAEAPLTYDDTPSLYVYSLVASGCRQTGLAVAASVEDYDRNIIKKHEKTRKDKEDDRTRHILTLRSHTGPVFLTYRGTAPIDNVVEEVMAAPALFDVTFADGVQHQLWRVPVSAAGVLQEMFEAVPYLYVADGHHRAKSASRTAEQYRVERPGHTGAEDYNRFLAVVFPSDQLRILAYNRVVKDLNGRDTAGFLAAVREVFDCVPTTEKSPETAGCVHMYLAGHWYSLKPSSMPEDAPVTDLLDVSILQNGLLAPILGIADPRTDKRIDFVGGIRGTAELEKRVDSGEMAVAFSMYPTSVDQLMAIADAGEIMPPKSTWFEPKLRDGFLCHCF